MRCNLCRRTLHYLASDLVTVYHPSTLAHTWRPACSACGKADYVSVRSFSPGPDDVGKLVFRRPAGYRRVQLWRNELYGK